MQVETHIIRRYVGGRPEMETRVYQHELAYHCPHCGAKAVFVEVGEGDSCAKPEHLCAECGSSFTLQCGTRGGIDAVQEERVAQLRRKVPKNRLQRRRKHNIMLKRPFNENYCATCKHWDQKYPESPNLGVCIALGVQNIGLGGDVFIHSPERRDAKTISDFQDVRTISTFGCTAYCQKDENTTS